MAVFDLDCTDIAGIFKDNLKIENTLKSIAHIFLNERYVSKTEYAPYFQRNYVWDQDKATYFIESILLGTDIPPLVLFDDGSKLEVIDGRQRYETIKRFVEGGFSLRKKGLVLLSGLAGKKYDDLPPAIRNAFEDSKLRILQFSVVNEPSMSSLQKDQVKKEIFNRYNSGIIALKSVEIERAQYLNDSITRMLQESIEKDDVFFEQLEELFGPARRQGMQKRDRVNHMLSRIRMLLVLPYIPIAAYAPGRPKNEIIRNGFMKVFRDKNPEMVVSGFQSTCKCLFSLREKLVLFDEELSSNALLHEACHWGFSILLEESPGILDVFDFEEFSSLICEADANEFLWKGVLEKYRGLDWVFLASGSHYKEAILARYIFISNCFTAVTGFSFEAWISGRVEDGDVALQAFPVTQVNEYRLTKTDPASSSVFDIIQKIKKSRFLVRPDYQRSEVVDRSKASYLLESIMLGIRIPPIFVYKRLDGVTEVVDGQQRLLAILGFLGEAYLDEHGETAYSEKNRFKLTKLRILEELNGADIDKLQRLPGNYRDKILDFNIDLIEIDQSLNEKFSPLDLFVRLNQKPYPIKQDSFEMWNSYIDRDIIGGIKQLVSRHPGMLFKQNDKRMMNEERVTLLAYADYRIRHQKSGIVDVFDIFVRNSKVHVRIRDKKRVTNTLDEVTHSGKDKFLISVDSVEEFLCKLESITGNGFNELRTLVSSSSNTHGITNQHVYLLWIALRDVELEWVKRNPFKVFSAIRDRFQAIQDVPIDFDWLAFIDDLRFGEWGRP